MHRAKWSRSIKSNDNRYSDEDFALILKRAAELQDRAEGGPAQLSDGTHTAARSEGMSLAEVRDIAGEVGLDARFVEQAAESLALTQAAGHGGLLGGPLKIRLGETFDRHLTDGEQMEVVETVRALLGNHGEVTEVMGSVEWKSVDGLDQVMVTITATDDDTSIRIFNDLSGFAALTWIGSVTAGLVAGGLAIEAIAPGSALITASILGTGGAVGLGVARTIWSRTTKSFRRKSERIRDAITRRLNS